jgi:hypothetical protein
MGIDDPIVSPSSDDSKTSLLSQNAVMTDCANATCDPLTQATANALAQLGQYAGGLVRDNTAHPMVHLRTKARQLKLLCSKAQLELILGEAQDQASEDQRLPHRGGDTISLKPTTWLLMGVLIRGALNVLVGPGKIGKTALVMGLLKAMTQGASSYLGLPVTGPCPPVLLVGTDQPLLDWTSMLLEYGLACRLDDGKVQLNPTVSELYDSQHPLWLNQTGISAIEAWCVRNPGGLVILDSAASLTLGLGISENSRMFARPFSNLMTAVSPLGATVILIHHTSKANKALDPAQACRGTSALPALASQLVGLFHYPAGKGSVSDPRIVLVSKGRGGAPTELVIERSEAATWISHGALEDVQAAAQQCNVHIAPLNDRQRSIYEALEEQHRVTRLMQTATQIRSHLPATITDLDARLLRRALEQLEAKGLLVVQHDVATSRGRENLYGSKAVQEQIDADELARQEQGEEVEAGQGETTPDGSTRLPLGDENTSAGDSVELPGVSSSPSTPGDSELPAAKPVSDPSYPYFKDWASLLKVPRLDD